LQNHAQNFASSLTGLLNLEAFGRYSDAKGVSDAVGICFNHAYAQCDSILGSEGFGT